MFGIRYIWSCYQCRKTWEFKSKSKHKAFRVSNDGCCPYCGDGLSQLPFMPTEVPMPSVKPPYTWEQAQKDMARYSEMREAYFKEHGLEKYLN